MADGSVAACRCKGPNKRTVWERVISQAMCASRVSISLEAVVRREHRRRGYGRRPTVRTVAIVAQACEEEGIFGPCS